MPYAEAHGDITVLGSKMTDSQERGSIRVRSWDLARNLLAKVTVTTRQLFTVLLATALSFAVLNALALGPASASTNGAILFVHSFTQNSLSADSVGATTARGAVELPTVPSGTNVTCLTVAGGSGTPASCSGASDAAGSGVLQLTADSGGQEGALFSTLGLPTSNGLDVTFDSYQYQPSGTGADGLAFVVAGVNPSTLADPSAAGNPGGSLGYAPVAGTSDGLSYGYLGMGMDVYGNYSTAGVDGTGCTDPAYIATGGANVPGQVLVRGPGNLLAGYCALASTATSTGSAALALTSTTRAGSLIPVEVAVNPTASSITTNSGLSVGAGDWEIAFTPIGGSQKTLSGTLPSASAYDPASWLGAGGIPKDIAFGWVASTGGSEDYHAVSNVEVQTFTAIPVLDAASNEYGTPPQGNPVTYVDAPTVDSSGSTESQAVTVTDTLPTGVTPTSGGGSGWSCSAPSGQTISCTTSTSGPWTAGTTLPSVYINGVVISASETQGELSGTTSGNYVLMSSSDANPVTTYSSTQQTEPSAPTVTSVSPTSGPIAGGGSVTVTGTNLSLATQVEIGTAAQIAAGVGTALPLCASGAAAGCFTESGSQVSISSMPAEPAGTDGVYVTTEGESASAANYTYDGGGGGPTPPTAQTVTFTSQPPAAPTVGGTYTISATAPGGPVSFSLDASSSGCSLGGAVVTFTGFGTCTIDASTPANTDYLAATASQSIVISQLSGGAGLGSIASVTATAGDGQVLVSWSAPSNVSKFKNVSYAVTASPGGASCDSTGTLSCLVTGISDSVSYTFMVTASSNDPTSSSITSSASSPVTPTDAPFQNGTTTLELSPGSADVIQSGSSTTKVGVTMRGDSVIATGQGLQVVIAASATTGKGTKATVVLITGGTAWFSGSGFLRGSVVAVYAFSRATLLGTGVVKSNGKFSATLRLPAGLAIGSHTIQLQGFATSDKRLAVAIGVAVRKQVTQSIVIGNFGVCSPSLTASMKTQLSNLSATIKAQRASSVVITGYTYSTGGCAKTLSHTQAAAAANYLLAGLKHLGYKGAPRMVIRVGRATSQALSRRVTVAVTLG